MQALVAVLALLLLGGITLAVARLTTGDEDAESSPEAPVTTVASAASPTVSTEQAVLEAYRRAGQAFEEASTKADPAISLLRCRRPEKPSGRPRPFVAGLRSNGLVIRGTTDLQDLRVLAIDEANATVRARVRCF